MIRACCYHVLPTPMTNHHSLNINLRPIALAPMCAHAQDPAAFIHCVGRTTHMRRSGSALAHPHPRCAKRRPSSKTSIFTAHCIHPRGSTFPPLVSWFVTRCVHSLCGSYRLHGTLWCCSGAASPPLLPPLKYSQHTCLALPVTPPPHTHTHACTGARCVYSPCWSYRAYGTL